MSRGRAGLCRAGLLGLAALALAGCPGTVPPQPQPRLALSADFSGPSIGVAGYCLGWVPVTCALPQGALWGTFNAPGTAGQGCLDPGPNQCYTATGTLAIRSSAPGWPIISAQTFSKDGTISLRTRLSGNCVNDQCWGGPVIYNGDATEATNDPATGEWRGLYYSQGVQPGTLRVAVWGPSHIQDFGMAVPVGTEHELRLDYAPGGTWTYYLDGALLGTETPGSWSQDAAILSEAPHVALFMGELDLSVSSLQVWELP